MVESYQPNYDELLREASFDQYEYSLEPAAIRDKFQLLKLYLDSMSNFIAIETKQQTARMTSNDLMWTYPWWEDFEYTLRSSFLMSLSSVLENRLGLVRDAVAFVWRSPFPKHKGRGNIVEQTKEYIESLNGFEIPIDDSWHQVSSIYLIRNVLVHDHGLLRGSRSEQKLQWFVGRNPWLVDNDVFIRADLRLCNLSHEIVESFLLELFASCHEWCQYRKKIEFG